MPCELGLLLQESDSRSAGGKSCAFQFERIVKSNGDGESCRSKTNTDEVLDIVVVGTLQVGLANDSRQVITE